MRQYGIYIVCLDPTVGSELKKTRPCVIISPDEMNEHIGTVQVAPMTSNTTSYPWRVPIRLQGKVGMVALDQLRTVDKKRLIRKAGRVSPKAQGAIKEVIHEMLAL